METFCEKKNPKLSFGKKVTYLVLVWLSCAFANDCVKPFQMKSEFLNKRLNKHYIVELKVQNLHMCARECFYVSMCKSMDYFHGSCKLYDADSKSVSQGEFQHKPGSIFSDVSDWPHVCISLGF
jgi:hypothetical protein